MLGLRKSAFGGHFDLMMFMLRFSILRSRFNFESGQPSQTDPQYVNRGLILALYTAMAVDVSMELRMRLSRLILPAAFCRLCQDGYQDLMKGSRYLYCFVQLMEVSPTLMSSCLSLNIFSLFAVPKSIAFVFLFFRFMSSSFLQNQLARVLTSSFRWI